MSNLNFPTIEQWQAVPLDEAKSAIMYNGKKYTLDVSPDTLLSASQLRWTELVAQLFGQQLADKTITGIWETASVAAKQAMANATLAAITQRMGGDIFVNNITRQIEDFSLGAIRARVDRIAIDMVKEKFTKLESDLQTAIHERIVERFPELVKKVLDDMVGKSHA